MQLTIEEFNILIVAVDDWKNSDGTSGLLFGILLGGLTKDREGANEMMEQGKKDSQAKSETASLLKAKLIKMKDALLIKEATEHI